MCHLSPHDAIAADGHDDAATVSAAFLQSVGQPDESITSASECSHAVQKPWGCRWSARHALFDPAMRFFKENRAAYHRCRLRPWDWTPS